MYTPSHLRECLNIHHEEHKGTQRAEKTKKNLRKSVQSVAESCPGEHVSQVSTDFRNTLLGQTRWEEHYA